MFSKVFLGCGQPSLVARNKRQTGDDMTFGWKPAGGRQGAARPTTAAGTNIDRLMQEFREKLAPLKDLWKELPHSMCRNFTATEETKCWNGTNKNRSLINRISVLHIVLNSEIDRIFNIIARKYYYCAVL